MLKEWRELNRRADEIKGVSGRARESESETDGEQNGEERESMNSRSGGREEDVQEADMGEGERKRGEDEESERKRERARCTGKHGQRASSCPITSAPQWLTAKSTSVTENN